MPVALLPVSFHASKGLLYRGDIASSHCVSHAYVQRSQVMMEATNERSSDDEAAWHR